MLVLSRRRNESIMIGDNIEIIVVDVRGDKVRLGIRAPGDVVIHRREIFDEIKAGEMKTAEVKTPAVDPPSGLS